MVYGVWCVVCGVWCVVWWKLCRAQTEVELELELSDATRLRIDIIQERQQRLLCLPSFLHSHYWTNLPSRYASKPLDIPPVIHFRSTSIPTATTPVAEKGGISEDGPITTETKREKARSLYYTTIHPGALRPASRTLPPRTRSRCGTDFFFCSC